MNNKFLLLWIVLSIVAILVVASLPPSPDVHVEGVVIDRYGPSFAHHGRIVVEDHEGGRYLVAGNDFYYKYQIGEWFCEDLRPHQVEVL